MEHRPQSNPEEIANSIVHGAALAGSIAALPILIVSAARHGDALNIIAAAVFGTTLILLYSASTIYHALRAPRAKQLLRTLDHGAIYLLIAGTYTPFMFGILRGWIGWTFFVTIWALATIGIVAKATIGFRYPHLSTAFYLAMGWLIILAIKPFADHLSRSGMAWLAAGGLCYTFGVIFYVTDRHVRYGHAIWHVFVAAGSACHFFAVLWHSI